MANDLIQLNGTLHDQLKRVVAMKPKDIEFERERNKMMAVISKEINQTVKNSTDILRLAADGKVHINNIPQKLFGIDK